MGSDYPEPLNSGLHARYSNYIELGYKAFEVFVDFGQFYPNDASPRMHTRIVMSPSHAKALKEILAKSIEQYEQTYGKIPDEGEPDVPR
jgi:Protein of unknown function (DUF3467)